MLPNARTHDVRLKSYRVVLFVTLLATVITTTIATAQEANVAREKYNGQQRRKVQQARQINNNLSATTKPRTRRQEDAFRDVMRSGTRQGSPEFQALQEGLKWEIYRATDAELKTNQAAFQGIKKRLRQNVLHLAGQNIPGRKEREEFRQLVCTEALNLLKDLLKNNFQARSLAIELIPALEINTDSRQRRILDEAADVLVEVLADEQQPDAIKLRAAESVAQYLENVNPGAQIEIKFALAIREELKSWLPATAYQLHMIDALSRIRAAREVVGVNPRPVVVESLVSVMQDEEREPIIRCSAAGALGSVGIDQRINLEPLAWKVAQLAAEMGEAYNRDSGNEFWGSCSLELFLAFHHEEPARSGQQSEDGMLNRAPRSELIRQAYDQVLPICLAMLDNPANIDQVLINTVVEWVKANQPNSLRFDSGSPPVSQ